MHGEIQELIQTESMDNAALASRLFVDTRKFNGVDVPVNSKSFNSNSKFINEVLRYVCNTISTSFGPSGMNTIIHKADKSHSFSKDGWSIIRDLVFDEPMANTILDMIKNSSRKMATTVGDGSTSVVIIMTELMAEMRNNLYSLEQQGIPSFVVHKIFALFQDAIYHAIECDKKSQQLVKNKQTITIDEIRHLATTSSNGDMEIVNIICDIYSQGGFDTQIGYDTRNDVNSSYEFINSFEINRGILNPLMANVESETILVTRHENAKILVIDGAIERSEDAEALFNIIGQHFQHPYDQTGAVRPLIIVAKSFSPQINMAFQNIIISNRNKNVNIPLVAIEHSTYTKVLMEKLHDFACFVGATVIDMSTGDSLVNYVQDNAYIAALGECKVFEAKDSVSRFHFGAGDEVKITKRIAKLREGLGELAAIEDFIEREDRVKSLNERITKLSMKSAKIFIGGKTPQDIKNRGYLVDDTVKVCESALNSGLVRGSQLFIPTLLTIYRDEIMQYMVDNFVSEFGSTFIFDPKDFNDFNSEDNKFTMVCECVSGAIYSAYNRAFDALYPHANSLNIDRSEIFYSLTTNDITSTLDARSYVVQKNSTVINPLSTEETILKEAYTQVRLFLNTSQIVVGMF